MKCSQINIKYFYPSFKCQIVEDENFEKFAKKMIKNKDDFNDFLYAQEALNGVHKDTFLKIKEDEVNEEMLIENINPQANQPKFASAGINQSDKVFREHTNPALFGLLKLANPSTDEHKNILGTSKDEDSAQIYLWKTELDLCKSLESNPFWHKLRQVNSEINNFEGDTNCVDVLTDLYREKEDIALKLLKSRCAQN